MFGLGDDNKEQLQENMEDIKSMVESGDSQSQEDGSEAPQDLQEELSEVETSTAPEDKLQEEIEKFERSQGQGAQEDPAPAADNRTEQEAEPRQPESFKSSRDTGSRQEERSNQRGRVSKADIPEPAETREIDVPEIEKGPLFITQEKFKTASRLIGQMRTLTREIEDTVQSMEDDLSRDREKEQTIQQVLEEFEEDRRGVEGIVSPEGE